MENTISHPSPGEHDDPVALENFALNVFQYEGYENTLQDHELQTVSRQPEHPQATQSPLNTHTTTSPNVFADGAYNHLHPHWAHTQQNEDRLNHIQDSFRNTHQSVNPLGNPPQQQAHHDDLYNKTFELAQNTYVHQQGFNFNQNFQIGYRQQQQQPPLQPNSHPQSIFNATPQYQYRLQQGPQQMMMLPHDPTRQASLGSFVAPSSPYISPNQSHLNYMRNISNLQNMGQTLQWNKLHNPTLAQQRMMTQDTSAFKLRVPDEGTSKRQRNTTKPQEPTHLVGKDIPCQHCPSIDTAFKYFCNKKVTQPRYFCNACKKYFTYNGKKYKKVKATADAKAFTCQLASNKSGARKRKMGFEEAEATTSDSSVEHETLDQFKRTGPNPYNLRKRPAAIEERKAQESEECEDTSESDEDSDDP